MLENKILAIMTRDYQYMAGPHGFGDFISLEIQNTGETPIELAGLALKADFPEDPTESFFFAIPEGRGQILPREGIIFNIIPPGKNVPTKGWDMVLVREATGEDVARASVQVKNLKSE